MTNIFRPLSVVALLFLVQPALSAEWGVVGAGNATCEHWNRANPTTKEIITSWMKGFASSENLSRAAASSKEFGLEFLTSEYLSAQIAEACASPQKRAVSMSGIIVDILARLPIRQ